MPARKPQSPYFRKPSSMKKRRDPVWLFLLVLLLPPVGLIVLWRNPSAILPKGRLFFTIFAVLEMALLLTIILPDPSADSILPVPVQPAPATRVPGDDVSQSLSNIGELLQERQAAELSAAGIEPTVDPVVAAATQAAYALEQQEILSTTVYTYSGSGARFYHAITLCEGQSCKRALTVQEAMNEGLGACPNCNPPIYRG